ncbi:endonuclease/exonuclease/phosphatase family protein [Flammeovirga kamogawensis]|uniref:Endonuclease/exonuclease/phosphatase family protein n=1 Tax=Flammeovirga kamogawensis TaxID=373891 RepID=A0ABX8GX74_9BACT|nr:endonuclease/exonuclease/phosphatase family protein [Flammeovirga kamogawensis]MBB6460962.1 endonuclease/exonuclease/phosphatase family metal-dependent hydrolase [Flammeovirga kamogawensis]QWG07535.1 endonuclease/exonuclease/phosphatase family protein [Flammeovirga kamogawensis]TRX69347.1 hypothetical protein EO216_14890 [Flammeovirga kamogawensis]
MKQIIRKVLLASFIIIGLIVLFFFWAKSPNWDKKDYAQVRNFRIDQKAISDSTLSIISYNIGYLSGMTNNTSVRPTKEFYQKNMTDVLNHFKKHKVDILALQEIDYGGNRSYKVDQFDVIGNALDYKNGAMSVNWDKKYVPFPYFPPTVHFGKMLSGQAVLSNYPIEEHERVELSRVRSQPYYYSSMYLDRLAERVKIKVGEQEVMFFNVHTEAFDHSTRVKQIEFLKDWFLRIAEEMPVIMVGDFNSDPRYDNAGVLKFYDDERIGAMCAKENLAKKSTLTYPTDKAIEQLDFVFFSTAHFEVLEWDVLQEFGQVSDHFPVYTKLRLKKIK